MNHAVSSILISFWEGSINCLIYNFLTCESISKGDECDPGSRNGWEISI